jgi:hypothetical protein
MLLARSGGGGLRGDAVNMNRPPPFILPGDDLLFAELDGFPRVSGESAAAWLENEVPAADRPAAIYALSRRWLNRLIPAMGVPHAISESTNFLLLSVPDVEQIKRTLRFLEEARGRVLKSLASARPPHDRPKHVVVAFGERDDYDAFTAALAPDHERDVADTGGMFVSLGVPHIVVPPSDPATMHAPLVHELVHDCLSHLRQPLWLNEGLTQMLEFDIVSWRPFELDRDKMEKHAHHWTAGSIQDYWNGRSFFLPGDPQKLSYNLSVVLVRKILTEFAPGRESFWEFVRLAKPEDAGDAALREHIGLSLAELVGEFLGPGEWAPRASPDIEPPPASRR